MLKDARDTLTDPDLEKTLVSRTKQRVYWETTPLKEHVDRRMKEMRRVQASLRKKTTLRVRKTTRK